MGNDNLKIIQFELKKLGLSEKEALVYLNSLRMGNISVSQIAKNSDITRPTAYRILESLEKRGLVVLKDGLVWANSPDELLGLLRFEKRRIEEQEREFLRIISVLKATCMEERNSVNIFEGEKGISLAIEEFSHTSSKNIKVVFSGKWKEILPYSTLESTYKKIKDRLGSINIEEAFLGKIQKSKLDFVNKKEIKAGSQDDKIVVICDKVFVFKKGKVVTVSQKSIIESMELLADVL